MEAYVCAGEAPDSRISHRLANLRAPHSSLSILQISYKEKMY